MMIVTLMAERTSFLPRGQSLPSLVADNQCVADSATQKIRAAATIATAACCSPQNAANMD